MAVYFKLSLYKSALQQVGITMIEIAIVILTIGTIMATILGTKEIVRTAQLKKMASEVQSFGSAARAFEDKYNYLPGDFPDASTTLAGCQLGNSNFCQDGDGDDQIGRWCSFDWPECYQTGEKIPTTSNGRSLSRSVPLETSMFWKHLFFAGFIGSSIVPTANPDTPVWKLSHPGSSLEGSGYIISGGNSFLGGHVVVNLLRKTTDNPVIKPDNDPGLKMPGKRSLSVRDAMWIDEKYDNGPSNGKSTVNVGTPKNPQYVEKDANGYSIIKGGAGSGVLWWEPIGEDDGKHGTGHGSSWGCRRSDGQLEDTWETRQLDVKNCTFMWSVY